MKAFRFRLEKVLAWRRTELELEEYKMKQLSAEMDLIERSRAQLSAERTAAEREILGTGSIDGADLGAHAAFLVHLGKQERELLRRRDEQQQRLAGQHQRLIEARQRSRVLEKLKARRHAQWRADANRELEAFAAEAYLARWNAERP